MTYRDLIGLAGLAIIGLLFIRSTFRRRPRAQVPQSRRVAAETPMGYQVPAAPVNYAVTPKGSTLLSAVSNYRPPSSGSAIARHTDEKGHYHWYPAWRENFTHEEIVALFPKAKNLEELREKYEQS